jgi:nitronate monooxygenase
MCWTISSITMIVGVSPIAVVQVSRVGGQRDLRRWAANRVPRDGQHQECGRRRVSSAGQDRELNERRWEWLVRGWNAAVETYGRHAGRLGVAGSNPSVWAMGNSDDTRRPRDLFSIPHPVALAPMGGSAGSALAAAVSPGGGLGLVGGGRGERDWCERELAVVADRTDRAWGVGFLTWVLTPATLDRALAHRPAAVMLSFGDPAPFAEDVRRSGARLIVQVTDLDEARRALDVGADVIVAQGGEAGGHGGRRGTGAGGARCPSSPPWSTSSGRLRCSPPAASRTAAAWPPRSFSARPARSSERASRPAARHSMHRGSLKRSSPTPAMTRNGAGCSTSPEAHRGRAKYTSRTLRNAFLERWRGREDELANDDAARRVYAEAASKGDLAVSPVWAGEASDLIHDVPSATDLVPAMVAEAEAALDHASTRC